VAAVERLTEEHENAMHAVNIAPTSPPPTPAPASSKKKKKVASPPQVLTAKSPPLAKRGRTKPESPSPTALPGPVLTRKGRNKQSPISISSSSSPSPKVAEKKKKGPSKKPKRELKKVEPPIPKFAELSEAAVQRTIDAHPFPPAQTPRFEDLEFEGLRSGVGMIVHVSIELLRRALPRCTLTGDRAHFYAMVVDVWEAGVPLVWYATLVPIETGEDGFPIESDDTSVQFTFSKDLFRGVEMHKFIRKM